MKLFKCLSQNVSIIQDEDKKPSHKLKFRLRKRKPIATNGEMTVPRKNRGLSVRFALDENDKPYSNTEPLVEDSTIMNIDESLSDTNQSRPVVQSTSCGTDTLPLIADNPNEDSVDFDNPLSISDNSIVVDDNLNGTFTVNLPSNNFQLPLDESILSPTRKVQMYFSSMTVSNCTSLLNVETDESAVSFCTINDTNSQFEDSTVASSNKKCQRKLFESSGHFFQDRFTNVTSKDGRLQQTPDSVSIDSTSSKNDSHVRVIKRLVDCNLSRSHNSTVQESVIGNNSENTNNFNRTELESYFSGACDEDETVNDSCSPTESRGYDSAIMEAERLFQVMVYRDQNGFGFSFSGDCPPIITHVDNDSPAEKAGIMKGDEVLKVNNMSTHKSNSDNVAKFIRTLDPKYLVLELHRNYQMTEDSVSHKNQRGVITVDSICQSFLEETGTDGDNWPDQCTTLATDISNLSSKQHAKTPDEMAIDQKHKTIHHLMSLEEEYIDFMYSGIEKFSRPLRHSIFSSRQHTVIFQNIEKLVTISEYIVQEMKDKNASINADMNDSQFSDHSLFVYLPALAYELKIPMLCQAYETYAKGYKRSQTMLREMRRNKVFVDFMKEIDNGVSNHLTMKAFINRPTLHIQELYKVLKEVLALTPEHSPDFGNLQTIIQQLSQCVKTVRELCTVKKLQDMTSSQNHQKGNITRADKQIMTSNVNIKLSESNKSINIIRIQDKLCFSPNLLEYQQCLENTHLIYHGNVYKCNKKGSWIKHELLLFSELLLMANEMPDGSLRVSDNPIRIQDLAGLQISRAHSSEFVLHLRTISAEQMSKKQPTVCYFDGNGSTMILRAASAQDKFVWKSLLLQRVPAITGQSLHIVIPTKLA